MKEYFKYAYELPPNDFLIGFTDLDVMFKYNNRIIALNFKTLEMD